MKNRGFKYSGILFILMLLGSCTKTIIENKDTKVVTDPLTGVTNIDPSLVISINSNSNIGPLYNFWSTRPMVNQNRFTSANFVESLSQIRPYVATYNLVRVLGGRTDELNEYYKGVDASGNVITDFSGFLTSMKAFMKTGFKPRIVLDNVPWGMVAKRVENTYGNTNPPDDYVVWRKYINAFMQVLIKEFGYNEVKTWRFRVGTEPNYFPHHWNGTKEQFFKHYDITVDEVTKVIPEAIIGPGNQLTESGSLYTTDLIDHCAKGTNYATGKIGTKMDFFSISYYERLDEKRIRLPALAELYRSKLNNYPQFSNIPFDIQEFGILRDDFANKGVSLSDATEFGASWYAAIADIAFKNKISEIYDWGQEIDGTELPSGRRHVTTLFQMMEGGNRLQTINNFKDFAGIIPVLKNNRLYLLIYNHNTTRDDTSGKTIYPKIEGAFATQGTKWKVNEWTVDKTNGIFMHELYKDCNKNGVATISKGRIYGNRISDYFADTWSSVYTANKAKYETLAKLPQTITDGTVEKKDGAITLKVDMASHSVKLIELIPQ